MTVAPANGCFCIRTVPAQAREAWPATVRTEVVAGLTVRTGGC